jgi:hypothetical protein
MTTKSFAIIATVLLSVSGAAIIGLQRYSRQLRGKIENLSFPSKQAPRLREENQRLKRIVEQTQQSGAAAEQAMAVELEKARTELRELQLARERQVTEKHSRAKADVEFLNANRNPENGPVRIENFQNLGRETPSAAFQTLVWAAITGDDEALAKTIVVEGTARAQLEELLSSLPSEARAKYPTPEKLVALVLTGELFKSAAAEIRGQTNENSDRTILTVRLGENQREAKIPLQRTPDGWRLSVSDEQVQKLIKRLRDTPVVR